jgi:hypothetical protein
MLKKMFVNKRLELNVLGFACTGLLAVIRLLTGSSGIPWFLVVFGCIFAFEGVKAYRIRSK